MENKIISDDISAVFEPDSVQQRQEVYTNIVAKYYGDPDFKTQVDADPTTVLKAEGLIVPDGVEVKLAFNTPTVLHIVLPARSSVKE